MMPQSFPDFDLYEELEISPRASMAEVREAYLRLARMHHPDRAGAAGALRMVRLNKAHGMLADPEQRRAYNAHRRAASSEPARETSGRAKPENGRAPAPPAATRIREQAPDEARSEPLRCSRCGGVSFHLERRRRPRRDTGPSPDQDRSRIRICRNCGAMNEVPAAAMASKSTVLPRRPFAV